MFDEVTQLRIERIKSIATISSLHPDLKAHGSSTCPFCNRKNKAYVYGDQFFKCYSSKCEVKADVIGLYRMLHGSMGKGSFFTALAELEKEYGIGTDFKAIETERITVYEEAASIYHSVLFTKDGSEAREYLYNRGFDKITLESHGIGFAPNFSCLRSYGMSRADLSTHDLLKGEYEYFSNRIIFPIRNSVGRIVHLVGRHLGDVPKDELGDDRWPRYKDSKPAPGMGSTKTHLVFEEAIKDYGDTVFLTEGYPDALTLRQRGIPVLGILGLEGLVKQAHKFEQFKHLIVVADNDYFEADHPTHPLEYKSWRRLIPQLVELQLLLPHLEIKWRMVPEGGKNTDGKAYTSKDINDWFLRSGGVSYEQLCESDNLVSTLIERWGPDLSRHQELLRLIHQTGHRVSELGKYVPQEWGPIEYALNVLGG